MSLQYLHTAVGLWWLHLVLRHRIFPVFLAWHCVFHAPPFRCHREILAALDAGTCAGSRAWNTFSTSLFLVAFSHLSSVFFFCLHNTRLLIVNIDCEQYTHTYSTNRACTQHNHISSREHACLKDCASLCPYNNCHPRVMSHLPLFAFSPIFSLTFTDTHNTFGAR